jgi:hypothetical protein
VLVMEDDAQPIEDYLDHLRGCIQVKLARGGAPADRETLQMVCLAIGQTVMDPAHLRLVTMPPPSHLLPVLESIFTNIERDFADEIADLQDVIADAQEDPDWQEHILEAIEAGAITDELSVPDHIALLILAQFVDGSDGTCDDAGPS